MGDIVTGTVSTIVDFGAFVDLDGIDGLIHISELSWSHVNHPSEVVQVGEKVKVQVLDIDRDRQRISLGLKQTQEDPWQKVVENFPVGDDRRRPGHQARRRSARSSRSARASRASSTSPSWPSATSRVRTRSCAVGQEVNVKIMEVDPERRRLCLSIKRVDGDNVKPLRPLEPRRG